jgi:REP element-mobilizing transposase RayT
MSRKIRVWHPGSIFHITSRGNRHATLFYDDYDRKKYLTLLNETCEKFPFYLHAYCLMTNHIHLLLEIINDPPGEIIKMAHSLYAIYFNKRHELDGHVFQGRYKSELIDSPQYLLEASRYIHLNPVKAGIVEHPAQYPWSSYLSYVTTNPNPFIVTQRILSHVPYPKKKHYQQYVEGSVPRLISALKQKG